MEVEWHENINLQIGKNVELINECLELMKGRNIVFTKVKSHINIY